MNAEHALQNSGLPRLEAEILLAAALQKSRTWLIAHPDESVDDSMYRTFQSYCERRKKHEPVAYITGQKEFYGYTFSVSPAVLIPRPATESLIESAIHALAGTPVPLRDADTDIVIGTALWGDPQSVKTIIDVGTGSGCIAITLMLLRPEFHGIGVDIASSALEIAKGNATNHNVHDRITWVESSLLSDVECNEPFLVVTNPPYIPNGEPLMSDVGEFEPHAALFGGTDGMDIIRSLVIQAKAHPKCVGVIMECRKEQWQTLLKEGLL